MEPNSLYYTFSTIAQTLAGALGVLGAFALFALAGLEGEIARGEAVVMDLKSPFEPAWATFREKGMGEFLRMHMADAQIASSNISVLNRAEKALKLVPSLRRSLVVALLLTAGDIAISIVAIPFVPRLAASWICAGIIAGVAVVLAVVCLAVYGLLVWSIIPLRRNV
jgi:hypothetical protein